MYHFLNYLNGLSIFIAGYFLIMWFYNFLIRETKVALILGSIALFFSLISTFIIMNSHFTRDVYELHHKEDKSNTFLVNRNDVVIPVLIRYDTTQNLCIKNKVHTIFNYTDTTIVTSLDSIVPCNMIGKTNETP